MCYCTARVLEDYPEWRKSRGQYQNNMRKEEVYRVTKTRPLTIYITKAR